MFVHERCMFVCERCMFVCERYICLFMGERCILIIRTVIQRAKAEALGGTDQYWVAS